MKKTLEEIRELLIITDMIKGFVKSGKMADPYINHITEEIIKIILQKEEGEIIFIRDWHSLKSTELTKFLIHCLENSEESEIIDELKSYVSGSNTYFKNSTSAIWAPNFLDDIKKMENLKRIILVGCCTDICILNLALALQTYFDQNNLDIEIIVPQNAVETFDAPGHDREEYNKMASLLMKQAGIQLVKKYGGNKYGK